jgi:RNA polymerase sigma factor (sigma-70 family)
MAAQLDDEGRQRVEEHEHIARRMANARWRGNRWIDRDDLIGAASYGLCRASANWRGRCPFDMFAIQVIDDELTREVGKLRAGRADHFEDGDEYLVVALQDGDDETVSTVFAGMPEQTKEVFSRVVFRGQRIREVARDLRRSCRNIRISLKYAKRRLREQLAAPA